MRGRHLAGFAALCLAAMLGPAVPGDEGVDSGVIRLGTPAPETPTTDEQELAAPAYEGRRGFDYQAFGARLEGYWFQRKLQLREGRDDEAYRQAANIGAFVKEEGVRRLESPGGALLAEAARFAREGNYERANNALALAEVLDPGRPQTRLLRARIAWDSGAGAHAALAEFLAGAKASLAQIAAQPDLLQPLALKLLLALLAMSVAFPLVMVVRYQAPLRHEAEEWLAHRGLEALGPAGGWAYLLLPLVVWIGAGWIAVWWTLLTFRFMRRAERFVAAALLVATAFAVPGYRLAIGLYGLATDPKVRTSVAASTGAYDPDRIVKLRELVETYPDDPTYRFLLAGLYKNGRFFEEAFEEYKRVLKLAPDTWQARVNIGNIFFQTGQYGEAIAQYKQATEMRPRDVLAYCNMSLAQTESFRLSEAKATFEKARAIDAEAAARVLSGVGERRGRPTVVDATIDLGAIWKAAVEGRKLEDWLAGEAGGRGSWNAVLEGLLNPLSVVALLAVVVCGGLAVAAGSRPPAGRCVRCGRPYCSYCKTSRDGHEYCRQCEHLFVLQDGLAPETKTRKLYEVDSYDRRSRLGRRLASLVVPGSGLVLRGRAMAGSAIVFAWLVALSVGVPATTWPVERLLGFDVRLDLLRAGPVPGLYDLDPALLIAVPLAVATWIAGNAWLRHPREA